MRVILHSDLNNFYASCEQVYNPSYRELCLAVCGSIKDRHGIILAKNYKAKAYGIQTGMTIKAAQDLCPDLVCIQANFDRYLEYSEKVRKIYLDYTDLVEPFGIDEAWLDVTASKVFGTGKEIADEIRGRVRKLGLTASVGVSFNKIFAKLGSDMKKPDATTVISESDFKNTVWRLPVGDLLMVGRKTAQKLDKFNIKTIGDLANNDCGFLKNVFGKHGEMLYLYANGQDFSPVRKFTEPDEIKSIGNSMTCYRDLLSFNDTDIMFSVLCDSVSSRLLKKELGKATTLSISVRDDNLETFTRQTKIEPPSALSEDFFITATELFKANYNFSKGVRSLGVSVSNFVKGNEQLSIFDDAESYEKKLKFAKAVGVIREKYGSRAITKGMTLGDTKIARENPEEDHTIHPDGFKNKP